MVFPDMILGQQYCSLKSFPTPAVNFHGYIFLFLGMVLLGSSELFCLHSYSLIGNSVHVMSSTKANSTIFNSSGHG